MAGILDALVGLKQVLYNGVELISRQKWEFTGDVVGSDDPLNKKTTIAIGTIAQKGFSSSRTVTDAFSFALTDAGAKVYVDKATGVAATVEPNATAAFEGLETITVIQVGAGAVTLTAGAGVTLIPPNGKSLVTNGAGAVVGLTPKPGALNTWNVYGDLV